jgi:hypothetical protein
VRKESHPWIIKAEELLADGAWHDGLTVMREVEKTILPGVAVRRNEMERFLSARRRGSSSSERVKERETAALIAMGKLGLMQTMVHSRIRAHSWQVNPWPMPEGGWHMGGWEVRDLRRIRLALTQAATRLNCVPETLRKLLAEHPELECGQVGRVLYVYDLAGLEKVVAQYKAERSQQRGKILRDVAERIRSEPVDKFALTTLAGRSHISDETARKLQKSSPQLPWIHRGRSTYLPIDYLPHWEGLVQKWRAGKFERRSNASRAMRAKLKEKAAQRDEVQSDP